MKSGGGGAYTNFCFSSLSGVYWGVGGWLVFSAGYGSDGKCTGF